MHLCLIANTGGGKSTLAKRLAERLELPVISSGAVARELSDSDASTRLALQQGAMAPEQPMRAAIRAAIEEADLKHGGWILDGFPRDRQQLICLLQWSSALPTFLHLDTAPWVCVERLLSRQREHDNPDAIVRRLDGFQADTVPLIEMLRDGGVLIDVYGEQPVERAADHVCAALAARR